MIEAWEATMPARWRNELRTYSQIINSPVIGCDGNYAFPSFQLNVAPAQHGHQGKLPDSTVQSVHNSFHFADGSLEGDAKKFGIVHRDACDFSASMSAMMSMSDIPDDEDQEPGRFHFLPHGFYTTLEPWKIVFFSGLLPHGGTAPLAGPGKKAPRWAYRAVLIGYPPKYILSGDIKHAFAALPNQSHPLYITSEMTGVK